MNTNLIRSIVREVSPERRFKPGSYRRDKFTFPMHYRTYKWMRRLSREKGAYKKHVDLPDIVQITMRF